MVRSFDAVYWVVVWLYGWIGNSKPAQVYRQCHEVSACVHVLRWQLTRHLKGYSGPLDVYIVVVGSMVFSSGWNRLLQSGIRWFLLDMSIS